MRQTTAEQMKRNGKRQSKITRMIKKVLFASFVVLMLMTGTAVASDTVDVDVSIEIPTIFIVDWSVSGSSVDLTGAGSITAADFTAGYRDGIQGGVLSLTANDSFDLTVKASSDTFMGGSSSKPTSEMLVQLESSGYTALNGTGEVVLIDGNPPAENLEKAVSYRVDLFGDDTPGIYQTTLTYTIKASI